MSIFQIVCIMMLIVAIVIYLIAFYLGQKGCNESDFISMLATFFLACTGTVALLLGSFGMITIGGVI